MTKEEIEAFHKTNLNNYVGKLTDKGTIEDVEYLTFVGGSGGNYHKRPQIGKRGLIVSVIGKHSYPIGDLIFNQP